MTENAEVLQKTLTSKPLQSKIMLIGERTLFNDLPLFSQTDLGINLELEKDNPTNTDAKKIKELINRCRRQLIVSSIAYYRMDSNLVSDQTFDA